MNKRLQSCKLVRITLLQASSRVESNLLFKLPPAHSRGRCGSFARELPKVTRMNQP
jgi:hypothetical protein